MQPKSDYGRTIGRNFSRMPRRLRRLRFTSQKILPIIRLLPTRTNVMGLCLSKCHWGLTFISLRLTTFLEALHNRRILIIADRRRKGHCRGRWSFAHHPEVPPGSVPTGLQVNHPTAPLSVSLLSKTQQLKVEKAGAVHHPAPGGAGERTHNQTIGVVTETADQ